ncbi:MAG: mechanosensitive ion channel family protein, partial [Candidatus Solibacter usitatus]|nr:mechanosensitive ion channel family protein [Candidatus Solibacter usitatus]
LVLRALYRRAAGARSPAYLVAETLRLPSVLWSLAAALHFALQVSEAPEKYTHRAAQVIVVFLVVSLCMVAATVSVRMFALYGQRKGMVVAASGLARTLIRVLVFTVGAVFLLWFFGKQVTGVLAALGVGGLAFALALQDTLANFFAGIHILVEEPISVGNAIRLSEKEEGVVTDIGWRTTRVRTARNNVIVVPNTKITSGILTNYSLPEARVGLEVPVLAAHEADPDLVLRIALEEVRGTPGVLPDPAPNVLFVPGFLPTHLEFKAVFAVADFAQQGPVGSEVRLRILRRLRAEGVPLPRVEIR